MSIKVLMPALSPTMKEGKINNWLVKIGDKVRAGDVIAEIETDKATMEVEAVDEGTITHIINSEKNKPIAVNQIIALIDGNKDDKITIDSDLNTKNDADNITNSNDKIIEEKIDNNNQLIKNHKNILASPFVKNYSKNNNINLKNIEGTGPKGRIIKRDIVKLNNREELKTILGEYEILKPSNMRNIIAKRTTETKQQVPHFYLTLESNADKLIKLRNNINEISNTNVSFNDILVKAIAIAINKNKNVNVSWINENIYQYSNIDISIAVALSEGLITPIIKDADKKGIIEISSETKNLIKKAKENKLLPEEYTGGSITISNLGMFGINEFSAIINPPQSMILAVGKINKKPIVIEDKVKVGHSIKFTLSVDHRALDGAIAANFLQDFNGIIENPFQIWLESNDLEII